MEGHLHVVVVDFFQWTHLSVSVEKGHGFTRDHNHTWKCAYCWVRQGQACSIHCHSSISILPSHLEDIMLNGWCSISGIRDHKLLTNGPKCQEMGWSCIHFTFPRLASHLAAEPAVQLGCYQPGLHHLGTRLEGGGQSIHHQLLRLLPSCEAPVQTAKDPGGHPAALQIQKRSGQVGAKAEGGTHSTKISMVWALRRM